MHLFIVYVNWITLLKYNIIDMFIKVNLLLNVTGVDVIMHPQLITYLDESSA